MKFIVYDGPRVPEKVVYLKLEENTKGGITLRCVDRNGENYYRGSLLTINKEGNIILHDSIEPGLGFPLRRNGSLKIL